MNAAAAYAPCAVSSKRIAAFFDLDGTLLPLPSLERRFFQTLRKQRAIPAGNYLLWLAQTLRLAPNGISVIAHANKIYLRNVSVGFRMDDVPPFFPAAMDRITWHAARRHAIVLITGTLAPLASEAALALTLRLIARGITTLIAVCATQLEQVNQRWTGRIDGDAMFGPAKVREMRRLAAKNGFDLAHSYAYGDGANDRWMLGAAGQPAAVNPSRELERIARLRHWPILIWKENDPQHDGASALCEQSIDRADRKLISRIETETLG